MRLRTRSALLSLLSLFALAALGLAACSDTGLTTGSATNTPGGSGTAAVTATPNCAPPSEAQQGYSPQEMRDAYGITSLIQQGYTGKGQTIAVIESFGDPTIQSDVAKFSQAFCLPAANVTVMAPLGTKPFDSSNSDMTGWAGETSLDVELVHALAPDAKILVMTSPVSETEGTIGLPQFLQLEQQVVNNKLANIISQSFGASEVTLADSAGQAEIAKWTSFYQQATTQAGITFLASSGDEGATDYANLDATQISSVATTSFPTDEPWVLSTGGTTLHSNGSSANESAWDGSGGGFSSFFTEPAFQQALSGGVQSQLNNRRGVPDVSADSDPYTGMAFYCATCGGWNVTGGTSAAAPTWAAMIAIGDQMAGHGLGYLNTALYQIAASSSGQADFRDVTSGNNSYNQGGVNVQGYDAVPGWDPVTGLGSPIAEKLLPDLIAALGSK
jgi:subtilase family serine protease